MPKIFKETVSHTDVALGWFLQNRRLTRALGAMLLIGVLYNPVKAFGATLPGSHSVALAWDRSSSSSVTGYRVYYGAASGSYTNSVRVENVTTGTISGLVGGINYQFAVAACTASGVESDLSNGLTYAVPGTLSSVRVGVTSNRQVTLTVTGQSGHTYGIEATQDLRTWTIIGSVTLGISGSALFSDVNAPALPKRFYRIRE